VWNGFEVGRWWRRYAQGVGGSRFFLAPPSAGNSAPGHPLFSGYFHRGYAIPGLSAWFLLSSGHRACASRKQAHCIGVQSV
jgi:hypothetical protein